jgi:ABC-type nickel/cobalt efflux system permease component RcnA
MPRFSLEWFYAPITFVLVISTVVTVIAITFMYLGRQVSNTPTSLSLKIVAYLFLYGLIAPFWLVRSLYDVLTGHRRAWR